MTLRKIWFAENLVVPEESGFGRTKRDAEAFVAGMCELDEARCAADFSGAAIARLVVERLARRAVRIRVPIAVAKTLLQRCEEFRQSFTQAGRK